MNKAALFSLSALVALACAAPTSTDEPDVTYGDGDGDSSGGAGLGSGGVAVASGGSTPVGSGGSTPVGSGGSTPVGSGGSTPGGSGGAPPVGATCEATAFTATMGYADNGQMCGFAWTASFPEADAAVTITPPCKMTDGTDCFTGADLCATATVPASTVEPPYYPGVIIGWNTAQAPGSTTNGSWTATGTGLTPTFTTTGTGEVRVVLKSGTSEYCATATSGSPIPWASFKVECWDATSVASFAAGMPISQVMLQLNAGEAAQTGVDLCLGGIAVN